MPAWAASSASTQPPPSFSPGVSSRPGLFRPNTSTPLSRWSCSARSSPPARQDMSAAIQMEGLTKDYAVGFWRRRPYRALDDLTLEIGTGEVFGFLGPNGA